MPRELSCFVIIPSNWHKQPVLLAPDDRWGLSTAPSSISPAMGLQHISFHEVYSEIIQVAVDSVNSKAAAQAHIRCIRGEDIPESGDIRRQFIQQICEADITITDITSNNPNVLFEYGIRLSLKDSGNLLIYHEAVAGHIPFNIGHLRAIPYSTTRLSAAQNARNQIEQFLYSYLNGQTGSERNLYYEYVELFTGRLLEKKLTAVGREAPAIIATLAKALLATGDEGKQYREAIFDYLMRYKEALVLDPRDQDQVIEHLKLIAGIENLGSGRVRQTLYELAKICNNNPSRKEEGMRYLQEAKKLED